MKIISHRGNIIGPRAQDENHPRSIMAAGAVGRDLEVDVWAVGDGLFLGHDCPMYPVNLEFLESHPVWVHCKNLEAYELLKDTRLRAFYLSPNSIAEPITNSDWLWHSRAEAEGKGVFVDTPEFWSSFAMENLCLLKALCTDTPTLFPDSDSTPQRMRVLFLDVDGVLTDGSKGYDSSGRAQIKFFLDRDFTAIKELRSMGVQVVLISGDPWNEELAKNRNLEFLNSRHTPKSCLIKQWCVDNGASLSECGFVGDDLFDYDALALVYVGGGKSMVPKNHHPRLKFCTALESRGGEGCVEEILETFSNTNMVVRPTLLELRGLDNAEKF